MSKIIAIDFDGTLCHDAYPDIGEPKQKVINYAKSAKRSGCRLILWTNRAGDKLDEAVTWCKEQGIEFDAVNDNLPELVEKFGGSNCRKVFADVYIDDKATNVREIEENTAPSGITRQRLTRRKL